MATEGTVTTRARARTGALRNLTINLNFRMKTTNGFCKAPAAC